MKRWIMCIFAALALAVPLMFALPCRVYAVEVDDYDFGKVDDSLKSYDVDFDKLVKLVMEGKYSEALRSAAASAAYGIFGGFSEQKDIFVKLLLLGIVGALFKNIAAAFFEAGIARTGGYIIQLALMAVLTYAAQWSAGVAGSLLTAVVEFMQVLIPTYSIVITAGSGSAGAVAFYELAMFLILIVDKVLLKIVIPGATIYMIINMMNYISKDGIFGKLSELIKELLEWTNKALFGVVIGLNVIKGLISPMLDSLKGTTITKLVGMIPGAGTAVDAVAGIVLGSGALIKNSVGVAAMLVIIMLCAMPVIKLFVFAYGCKAAGAVLEPVAEKNYTECLNGMYEGVKLLMVSSMNVGIMFLLTIAIVCSSTNAAFFSGA